MSAGLLKLESELYQPQYGQIVCLTIDKQAQSNKRLHLPKSYTLFA